MHHLIATYNIIVVV